uniref:Uncharacterized protein n=1 Tax=Arundo donax TaxID=35708 RepID=A0A0A8ZZT4_ARUDO
MAIMAFLSSSAAENALVLGCSRENFFEQVTKCNRNKCSTLHRCDRCSSFTQILTWGKLASFISHHPTYPPESCNHSPGALQTRLSAT